MQSEDVIRSDEFLKGLRSLRADGDMEDAEVVQPHLLAVYQQLSYALDDVREDGENLAA